jgi:hypothetical protein
MSKPILSLHLPFRGFPDGSIRPGLIAFYHEEPLRIRITLLVQKSTRTKKDLPTLRGMFNIEIPLMRSKG